MTFVLRPCIIRDLSKNGIAEWETYRLIPHWTLLLSVWTFYLWMGTTLTAYWRKANHLWPKYSSNDDKKSTSVRKLKFVISLWWKNRRWPLEIFSCRLRWLSLLRSAINKLLWNLLWSGQLYSKLYARFSGQCPHFPLQNNWIFNLLILRCILTKTSTRSTYTFAFLYSFVGNLLNFFVKECDVSELKNLVQSLQ